MYKNQISVTNLEYLNGTSLHFRLRFSWKESRLCKSFKFQPNCITQCKNTTATKHYLNSSFPPNAGSWNLCHLPGDYNKTKTRRHSLYHLWLLSCPLKERQFFLKNYELLEPVTAQHWFLFTVTDRTSTSEKKWKERKGQRHCLPSSDSSPSRYATLCSSLSWWSQQNVYEKASSSFILCFLKTCLDRHSLSLCICKPVLAKMKSHGTCLDWLKSYLKPPVAIKVKSLSKVLEPQNLHGSNLQLVISIFKVIFQKSLQTFFSSVIPSISWKLS